MKYFYCEDGEFRSLDETGPIRFVKGQSFMTLQNENVTRVLRVDMDSFIMLDSQPSQAQED